MNSPARSVARPLTAFILIAFALVSLVALPGILKQQGLLSADLPFEPFVILGSWTPNIAAFMVLAFILRQKGGIRGLFRRWTMWRERPGWYLAALSPLGVAAAGALLFHLFDGTGPEPPEVFSLPVFAGILVLSLVTGAMGEELGWRGFALPRLQLRFQALGASVVLGLLWGLWHLPLWFTGMGWEQMPFWLFTWVCVVASVVMTWICNNTRGNMLLITLFHLFHNLGLNLMVMYWGVPMERVMTWLAIPLTLFALGVVLVYGQAGLRRKGPIPVDKTSGDWLRPGS